MKKIVFTIILISLIIPLRVSLAQDSNPKLANYFLHWSITEGEAKELAKWDLLVLDMEVQENSLYELQLIRKLNPDIKIVAYISSQNLFDINFNSYESVLRKQIHSELYDSWWLRDRQGNKLSDWHDNYVFNITDYCSADSNGIKFNDFLPSFVSREIISTGLWDGVFFDNVWNGVNWFNGSNVSLENNGRSLNSSVADIAWRNGVKKIINKTRELIGPNYIILANGSFDWGYKDDLNGWMLEDFPTPWENGGTWAGSINFYLNLEKANKKNNIINASASNFLDFKKFRFSYTSALLGNSYFSFDYGPQDHAQFWWYDEYDAELGIKISEAYNLLDKNNKTIKPGLWRSDFSNGVVIVNSTDKEQRYSFRKEEFDKLKGSQDPQINNGLKVNWINLASKDGVVLLKRSNVINNSYFHNGNFFRVFDVNGSQLRNGFFAYFDNFYGEQNLLFHNFLGDSDNEIVSARAGELNIFSNGKKVSSFRPYGAFKGNFTLAYINNNEIVTAAGKGGGPQISIFDVHGNVKSRFFAYDDKFRGGVSIATGDFNGDGSMEIVTAPISGGGPQVKVFKGNGQLKYSFFAYDKNFHGGISVAVADVDGDGELDIVTGPGKGLKPEVKVFTQKGHLKYSFLAYDVNYRDGIFVTVDDIDQNGKSEILAGISNF